jgi:ATP-dependent RNA helicase DeaD
MAWLGMPDAVGINDQQEKVMSVESTPVQDFNNMDLFGPVVAALQEIGYEQPTPIQAAVIPSLMAGNDVVGQAQTGTGKTAAFALPILSKIDVRLMAPQVLILTPTRELCIQVAKVFQQFASQMKGVRVLPIYGGQGFSEQLVMLKRGVHIVVGTPGRVMDHMRRSTLKLDKVSFLVLDEADEMLRMGFIDDVEWILEQTPPERQTALFSATIPPAIRRIARKYLKAPEEISIKMATTTAVTLNHRYWIANNHNKFEALTRILETEEHDGVLIFVKTKIATTEVAEGLCAAGIQSSALNGDMKQSDRERTVNRFKEGKLDILVATDVAARGLDVDRISHVINYDIPNDTEGYVHRVGRTGRAGRSGEAIILATPRERRFLEEIERATNQRLEPFKMPGVEQINRVRIEKFKNHISQALESKGCARFAEIIEEYQKEHDVPAVNIAAALANMVQGDKPLLLEKMPEQPRPSRDTSVRVVRETPRPRRQAGEPEVGMERYRVECGYIHGVRPGNIVGAIANEAGLSGRDIGQIEIFEDYSVVDLPVGMPERTFMILKKTKVADRPLDITILRHQTTHRKVVTRR